MLTYDIRDTSGGVDPVLLFVFKPQNQVPLPPLSSSNMKEPGMSIPKFHVV